MTTSTAVRPRRSLRSGFQPRSITALSAAEAGRPPEHALSVHDRAVGWQLVDLLQATAPLEDACLKSTDRGLLDRITQEPDKLAGKPCIRGLRISVSQVLGMLGEGMSSEQIRACLVYASQLAEKPPNRRRTG